MSVSKKVSYLLRKYDLLIQKYDFFKPPKTECARAWALTRLPILGCALVVHLNVDMFKISVVKTKCFSNITVWKCCTTNDLSNIDAGNVVKPMVSTTIFL